MKERDDRRRLAALAWPPRRTSAKRRRTASRPTAMATTPGRLDADLARLYRNVAIHCFERLRHATPLADVEDRAGTGMSAG